MSVRQSLLAILDQGPCYGYQLRAEFDRRTGSTWPLNVGQIYNTLDRLERDGLVSKGDADEQGHVYCEITDAGSADGLGLARRPRRRGQGTRDELAIKLAVAATLPGVDVAGVIRAQRAESQANLDALQRPPRPIAETEPQALARAVVADAMIAHAEAELRWLDRTQRRLEAQPGQAMGLATDRPKRGRPAKAPAA